MAGRGLALGLLGGAVVAGATARLGTAPVYKASEQMGEWHRHWQEELGQRFPGFVVSIHTGCWLG